MSTVVRGKADQAVNRVAGALAKYELEHPSAQIDVYRLDVVSIRARIVDPEFQGISRGDRHDKVWDLLEHLPTEILFQVSLLVLITPDEAPDSNSNFVFDHRARIRL